MTSAEGVRPEGVRLGTHQETRRALHHIRQRWSVHSPTRPFYVSEDIVPGVAVADFCLAFLRQQRARRGTRTTASTRHEADGGRGNESISPAASSDVSREGGPHTASHTASRAVPRS